MTTTLVRRQPHNAPSPSRSQSEPGARARDWAEIQERMLVPLYEAVYERLEAGSGTRILALECGSGLALLMAASRGATVTGVDTAATERLALARHRADRAGGNTPGARAGLRVVEGGPADTTWPGMPPYTLVTALRPVGCPVGDGGAPGALLKEAIALTERGSSVVLTGWGPPERCATASVLRVAARLAGSAHGAPGRWPAGQDGLTAAVREAGLRPAGSGLVACPFGYADTASAVRGLLSTGLFDAATARTDAARVGGELTEALRPHLRRDGTVWMPNVFRYLIARTV